MVKKPKALRPKKDKVPVHADIERRFGLLPNFFRVASESPEVIANLWGFARFAYLDNPLPSLFKERLFVYLSRFCEARYCITRHVGFLLGQGHPSGDAQSPTQSIEDILRLVQRPLPRSEQLELCLARCLADEAQGLEPPTPDSPLEEAVFACAAHVFLQTSEASRCLDAIRHILGESRIQHVLVFLAFIRTAHYWTKVHGELTLEDDLTQLLTTHQTLAEYLLNDPEGGACEVNPKLAHELAILRESEERHCELVRAHEALRESEERLQSILNRAPAAIFIKDPAGRYLFMNEQCARVLSVNREQALGRTDRDFLAPELAAQFIANDQRVWASGQLRTVEERVPQADGVHISLVQKFLLRDSQGRPYALSGIALDITPHLELEAAIQASEARLQLAQSAANIGVFDWDIAAQTGVWSPELERVWGLPVGSFDGTVEAWLRLVHPDDRTQAHAGIRKSLEDSTRTSEFEYRIVRPDGAVRWIYAKAKTLCDAEGHAARMVGVNLDITDRKEAQLRLERFAEELEQQVASRTHELVRSQDRLRALATELSLTEQRERKRLAMELHDHLQQLLVLGKLTIGQGKRVAVGVPDYEQVLKKVDDILSDALTYTRTLVSDLSPTVLRDHGLAAALQWLGTYMQKHNLTVTVTVPDKQEAKLPEEDQGILLFQSVRELLINSAKYAGTGQATLTMEEQDGNLCITVRDEGKGFDLADAAGIPNRGISSKYGLYSIQERMRAMGGSFTIDSARGQGTTTSLILPLTRAAKESGGDPEVSRAKPAHAPLSADDTGGHTGGVNIVRLLLVDDHALMRQGLRTVLDAYADIQVVGEARDGMEAVKLVGELRPRVVVMDINMPKMNGIEATAKIMQHYPETIIIGLSVNAAEDNREAMTRVGASRLLSKEVAVEQLHDAVHDAVTQRDKGKLLLNP